MRRTLRRVALAPVLIICAYLAAAIIGALIPGPVAEMPRDGAQSVEIGLIGGPIHYDFLLPATAESRAALSDAEAAGVPVRHPLVAHFLVGWGARAFYTTAGSYADITDTALARAVAGDGSVLRVEALGIVPPGFDYARISLTWAQYDALLAAIAATSTGVPVPGASFTEADGFLEARGRFHIFRTCNTWISTMLRAAGVEAGIWTPTPYAVRLSLWWHQG
ncbi:MAG: DUF2459 domain-containing protein [Roseicyclus sp.]|nr:DUF2459 domain-containing protein [Roseicyclus sp.]MBO6623888.1 DUF2459 domain-containing protein [Roseicyclus sp.]MBO6921096.1 DUF2459 domain-containing protein [Roseicyclus sp.]